MEILLRGVLNYKVSKGTNNIANRQAMTKEQMMQAINAGIDVVKNLKDKTDIIGLGENGHWQYYYYFSRSICTS